MFQELTTSSLTHFRIQTPEASFTKNMNQTLRFLEVDDQGSGTFVTVITLLPTYLLTLIFPMITNFSQLKAFKG